MRYYEERERGMDGWGARVETEEETAAIDKAIAHNGPSLIECIIDRDDCSKSCWSEASGSLPSTVNNITLDHFTFLPSPFGTDSLASVANQLRTARIFQLC